MAKRFTPLVLMSLFLLVGCQAQQSALVSSMPAPSFTGPVMQDDGMPTVVAARPAEPTIVVPQHNVPSTPAPSQKSHHAEPSPASWTPLAKANSWKWIVIHHSATPTGGAAAFDKMHKAKGWDELGYHFVVGNGTDTRNGQIEVGPRWLKQKWGAHTKTPDNQFNEHGIGICLVGNFDVSQPSETQLKSLAKLVSFLMKKYNIPADHVVGHRDCKSTDCPGRNMSIARIRLMSTQFAAGNSSEGHAVLARGELLHEDRRSAER